MRGQQGHFNFCSDDHRDGGSASSNSGTDQGADWINGRDVVGDQFPNFIQPPSQSGNINGQGGQMSSRWGTAESSSNFNGQVIYESSNMIWGTPNSFEVSSGSSSRYGDREIENNDMFFPVSGDVGNSRNIASGGSSYVQAPIQHANLGTGGYSETNRQGFWSHLCKSDGAAMDRIPPPALYSDFGASSGIRNGLEETHGGSCSSSSGCNLSCKRKVLEGGSSNMSHSGESSIWSSIPPPRHSSTSFIPPPNSHTSSSALIDQLDSIPPSDMLLLSGTVGNAESQLRIPTRRGSLRRPELMPMAISDASRLPGFRLSDSSPRHISQSDSLGLRLAGPLGPPRTHIPCVPQSLQPIPSHRGTSAIRPGGSVNYIGDRNIRIQELINLRSPPRSIQHMTVVPSRETSSFSQNPINSGLATGYPPDTLPYSTNLALRSGTRPSFSSAYTSHPSPARLDQQNSPVYPPWFDLEEVVHNGHFSALSSIASGSSFEIVPYPVHNNPSSQRSHSRSTFVPNRPLRGGFAMGHTSQTASERDGNRRLMSEIRQVLTSIHRGNNLRIEEYMLVEPFLYHGVPQMRDRYRDMRLDVDNMSYEELLALGEQIGEVRTGLSEETIMKVMKQSRYKLAAMQTSPPDQEPCCICQEAFCDNEELGTLDCGHEYHANCIIQWLVLKNLCPICKTTALKHAKND